MRGPPLFARGRVGYPDGDRLAVARDGTVRAVGGWRDASGRWLRRGTFVFRPEPGGVQESFPVRRGDRIEYSAFAVAPQLVGRRLVDGARRTTFSLPVGARIEPGYSSAEHRQLARVRLTVGAPAAGRLRILHAIGRAGHPRQLWVRAARRPPTARGEPLAD